MDEAIQRYGKENIKTMSLIDGEETVKMSYVDPMAMEGRRHSIYSRFLQYYRQDKIVEAGEVVLNECFVEGDDRYLERDSLVHLTAAVNLGNAIGLLQEDTTVTSAK